jgi:hypothetical protein
LVRKLYPFWKEQNKGDQLANFKQGNGDYGGIAGWSDDGADMNEVKLPANDFGPDMAGNVAEWCSMFIDQLLITSQMTLIILEETATPRIKMEKMEKWKSLRRDHEEGYFEQW